MRIIITSIGFLMQDFLKRLILSDRIMTYKSTIIVILILILHLLMVPCYQISSHSPENDFFHDKNESIVHMEITSAFIFENENYSEEETKGYKFLCTTQNKIDDYKISSRNTLQKMFSKTINISLETFSRPPPVV